LFITNKQIKLSADDFRKQNNYLLNIVIRLTGIRKPELWEMILVSMFISWSMNIILIDGNTTALDNIRWHLDDKSQEAEPFFPCHWGTKSIPFSLFQMIAQISSCKIEQVVLTKKSTCSWCFNYEQEICGTCLHWSHSWLSSHAHRAQYQQSESAQSHIHT